MVKYNKHERNKSGKHVRIQQWEQNSPAYRALSGNAVKVYINLKSRYNGSNNGRISYSSREAASVLNKKNSSGARALNELILLGFLRVTQDSTFAQKKLAREFEITAISLKPAQKSSQLPAGNRDFMNLTPKQIDLLLSGATRQQHNNQKKVSPNNGCYSPKTSKKSDQSHKLKLVC